MRRIGVLTSGGDSPGMNAAVMAVAKSARYYGMSLIGIKRGYNGTLCRSHHIEDDMVELDLDTILDIADQPGTYLRTARCLDFIRPEMRVHAANNIREMGIEGAWDAMQPADWRRYLIENGAKGIHEDDPISTEKLALLLKYKCKCEARPTVLGYTQRGRTPSAYDSWFAFEAGNLAVNLLRNGIGNQVIGIKDGRVYYLPIIEALKQKREFNLSLYNMINSL